MDKINIAFICPDIGFDFGRTKIIYNIIKQLKFNSKEFNIILITNKESKINIFKKLDIDVENIPISLKGRNPISLLRSILLLKIIVNVRNVQILHSHHRYSDLIAYIVSFFTKVKTISTVHSYVYGYKKISFLMDKIIFVSETLRKYYIDNYNLSENKTEVIYNSTEYPRNLKNINLLNQQKQKDDFKILCIGRLDYEKGQDILIKAMEKVWEQYPNIELIFVGSFSNNIVKYRKFGNKKIKLKFQSILNSYFFKYKDKITLIKSETTPWEIIIASDIVVIPSRIESFGLVGIEAGYLKKCVIAAKVGGLKEIIKHNIDGLLFESEDFNDLSDKIKFIYDHRQLIKLFGERLHDKVIDKFSISAMVNNYIKVYKVLLNHNHG